MDMENDLELERCDEELRRIEDRRKKVLERKNRRIRQIREKQLKDKEAWIKKFMPLLDKTLAERFGGLYWYSFSTEEICAGIVRMDMPAKVSGTTEKSAPAARSKTENNDGEEAAESSGYASGSHGHGTTDI